MSILHRHYLPLTTAARLALGMARFACALLYATPTAGQDSARSTRPRTAAEDLQLLTQVFNQIRVNHLDSVDTHRVLMAAIQAMVQATDPHSYLIPAMRLSAGKEEALRAGKLHPVPVDFFYASGAAVVARVASGTQASRQDILPGDELVAIGGQPVRAESAAELEIELSGPRNSAVALTLERRRPDGTYASFVRTVKRERFADETAVPASIMLDDTTGYIRITTFAAAKVSEELRHAVQELEKAGMQRLVLDLRDNGGGSLAEAAAVAGEFLPSGSIVYTTEGRRATTIDTGRVRRSFFRSERNYPLVVMIDEGTASAAELVAGALQDHDRAVIVGRPSFGKSLIMQAIPLSDGSVIELVIGQVRTPCGRAVQRRYRDVSNRAYYRAAGAERDTIGRPTCTSKGGRTLYGGGGIHPDVRFAPERDAPHWASAASELDLPLRWANQYVGGTAGGLTTLGEFANDPTLPASALPSFRALARENGVEIPDGVEADSYLRRRLLSIVAYVKWGSAAPYQIEARTDPAITEAAKLFGRFSGQR